MKKYFVLFVLLLTACSNAPEPTPSAVLEVQDGDVIELNPTIIEKEVNGKQVRMYGYNGLVPGPLIKAEKGATITVHVRNEIDTETTVHWHGLRHANKDDGVPDLTQDAIEPKQSHTYTVHFPDEGMYWYHPHVREDIQQDMGLYGNMLVAHTDPAVYNPVNREEILILDDILLDEDGEIVPFGEDAPNFALMGRFGNHLLVNGTKAEDYNLTVDRGEVVRFYVTNVANTRTFRIRIDGGGMKLVGSDVGRYEDDMWVDTITIAPAERYIVEVLFEDDGRYRISHETPDNTYTLGNVTVTANDITQSHSDAFYTLNTREDVIRDIEPFRKHFDRPVDKTLVLDIEMDDHMMEMHEGMEMHHDETGIEWSKTMSGVEWEDTMPMMNQAMASEDFQWKLIDKDTEKENMDIMWKFTKGDVVKVRIENNADSAHPMQHPIHFHGQRFLVLSQNSIPNTNLVWKDTVLVPIGHSVDLLFDMSNVGDWMFHCHIAEHLSNGMMGMFSVYEKYL